MNSEFIIPYPKGLWLSNSTKAPDGFCSELSNFIPTPQGLKLRKGNKIIDYRHKYTYMAEYISNNSIILFTKDVILRLDDNTYSIEQLVANTVGNPINFLETNRRLIFFFSESVPYELFFDDTLHTWQFKPLEFTTDNGSIAFNNFTAACRYRERLFFYKQGDNRLYYAAPLAYKGELVEFDITGIFNCKGNLLFVDIIGYTSGAGLESHLVCAFDSGDILVFDGTNPQDASSWRAVTAIFLGINLFAQKIRFGTSLYCLSSNGLIDLQAAIATSNVVAAKGLSDALNDSGIDYGQMKLYLHDKYLILAVNNEGTDYWFNFQTGGWFKINGQVISSLVNLKGDLYFINGNGELFKAFANNCDDRIVDNELVQDQVRGVYITNWVDLSNSNNKRADFLVLDLYQAGGEYTVYANVSANYNYDYFNKSSLPRQIARTGIDWSVIDNRTLLEGKEYYLWGGVRINAYNTIKFNCGAFGRSLAVKFEVVGLDVVEFVLGDVKMSITVASK